MWKRRAYPLRFPLSAPFWISYCPIVHQMKLIITDFLHKVIRMHFLQREIAGLAAYFSLNAFRSKRKNIYLKKCAETFALLDKSVYHIFGEDCARYVPDTGIIRKIVFCFTHLLRTSVPYENANATPEHHFHLLFAIFRSQSVNYWFAASRPSPRQFSRVPCALSSAGSAKALQDSFFYQWSSLP